MQVWLTYSAVTGYLLYLCSAKRRMAPTTPRRVRACAGLQICVSQCRSAVLHVCQS